MAGNAIVGQYVASAGVIYYYVGFTTELDFSFQNPSPYREMYDVGSDGSNFLSNGDNPGDSYTVRKMFRYNGFTTELDTSFDTGAGGSGVGGVNGVAWDSSNLIGFNPENQKFVRWVGFTTEVDTSFSSPTTYMNGDIWDGTNLQSVKASTQVWYKHVGFTTEIDSTLASGTTDIDMMGIYDSSNATFGIRSGGYTRVNVGFTTEVDFTFASPSPTLGGTEDTYGGSPPTPATFIPKITII